MRSLKAPKSDDEIRDDLIEKATGRWIGKRRATLPGALGSVDQKALTIEERFNKLVSKIEKHRKSENV